MSQLPQIVDRAEVLAQVQQEILDKSKNKFNKGVVPNKLGANIRPEMKGD
jgi:hypothetical protein